MIQVGFLGCWGEEVDAIDRYTEKIEGLTRKVKPPPPIQTHCVWSPGCLHNHTLLWLFSDKWREGEGNKQHKVTRPCSFCIFQKALGSSSLRSNSTVKKPNRVAYRVGSRAKRHLLGQSCITLCPPYYQKTSDSRRFLLPHFLLHDPNSIRADTSQHWRHWEGCTVLETSHRNVITISHYTLTLSSFYSLMLKSLFCGQESY